MTYSEFVEELTSSNAVYAWLSYGFGVVEITKTAALEYVVDSFNDNKTRGSNGLPTAFVESDGKSKFMVIGCQPFPISRIINRPGRFDRYDLPKREDVEQFLK